MIGRTAFHCAIDAHGKKINGEQIDSERTMMLLALSKADINAPVWQTISCANDAAGS